MFRISRIYLANAGYRLAWYPGLLLPFTDAVNGKATSTIYNLVNQGGKTTFLSLVLSVFDTRQDRFLQRLSNPGQHFQDYFDKEGLPGIIAVEWELPARDMLEASRHLITGQLVCLRKGPEGLTPDRHFFAFEATENLRLEDLPGPNLPGGQARLLRQREDAQAWLVDMERSHRGNFQRTTNQGDWEDLLQGYGLDVELLKKQVDFNRKEGAMDEAFLDFKTEQEFVSRFLHLTLNPERADQTQKLVAALCRKMAGRQQLQTELGQMERLSELFQPFAAAAADYQGAVAERGEVEQALGDARQTLALHRQRVMERQGEVLQRQQGQLREQKEQEQAAQHHEADHEALVAEQRGREHQEARAAHGAAEHAVSAARHLGKTIDAAQLWDETQCLDQDVRILNGAIAAKNEGLLPLREGLELKTGLYRQALFEAAQIKHHAKQAALDEARKQELVRISQGMQRKKAENNWRVADQLAVRARLQLHQADEQRHRLEIDQVLHPEESVALGMSRLEAETVQLTERIEALEEEASALTDEAARQEEEADQAGELVQRYQGELAPLQQRVQEGEDQRERLTHERVLARAADAETCNPDSEVLPSRVATLLHREQDRQRELEWRLARLREGQTSVDQTGLFGQDPDVAQVVRLLKEQGVPGAQSYAEYIAATVPQGEAARRLVLSNPGRFLGVALPSPERLQQAQALLEEHALELQRPVVLSVYSTAPETPETAHFVAAPCDGSLWNKDDAARRLAQLSRQLEQVEQECQGARERVEQTLRVRDRLQDYQAQFGGGQLARWRDKVADLSRLLASAQEQRKQAREAARVARERAQDRLAQAKALQKGALAQAQHRQQRLANYQRDYDAPYAGWLQQVDEAETVQRREQEAIDTAKLAEDAAATAAEKAREDAREREREAQQLDDKRAALPPVTLRGDAAAELAREPRPLSELESAYRQAEQILKDSEAERTAPMARERDIKQAELEQKRKRYGELYPVEAFPLAEVRAYRGQDYRQLRREAEAATQDGQNQLTQAAARLALAQEAEKSQERGRRYPQHRIAEVATFSPAELAERLVQAETGAREAQRRAEEARQAAAQAREQGERLSRDRERYETTLTTLTSLALETGGGVPDLARFAVAERVAEEVSVLIARHAQSKKALESAEKQAQKLYEAVRRLAGEEGFAQADLEIATMLRENSLDSVAADSSRVQNAIANRLDALRHDLEQMAGDFQRATETLMGLVAEALRILRRATTGLLLPNHVPLVGGKSVFRLRTTVLDINQEDRRRVLSGYMEELVADTAIPGTGAHLAATALMRLAGNHLNLRLLKMVEIEDEQYVPVDRLSHSGAEKISMALFLYFVTMRLRAEQQASTQRAESGVLLLDNPFAKATLRPIWVAIHGLAESMGLQLIIATGMNELETLSVFKRHLRLGKTEQDKSTGRLHVKVADYQFVVPQEEGLT